MVHFPQLVTEFAAFTTLTMAQDSPIPPKMTLLYSMEALLGERFSLGPVPTGQERIVNPIVGGTFKGPKMKGEFVSQHPGVHHRYCSPGSLDVSPTYDVIPFPHPYRSYQHHVGTILPTGSDWRLTDAHGAIRPDARYNLRIDDGTNVYIQTEGFPLPDGRTMLRGKFETGSNGTYAWLNDVVGVGVLKRSGTTAVRIEMWHAEPGA